MTDPSHDGQVEIAKITAKQAILVAIISVVGGIATTLVATGVPPLHADGAKLQAEIVALQQKINAINTEKARVDNELKTTMEALNTERQRSGTLNESVDKLTRENAEIKQKSGAPAASSQVSIQGTRLVIVYADKYAQKAIEIKKKLTDLGAYTEMVPTDYCKIVDPFVVGYEVASGLEAAQSVQKLLVQYGFGSVKKVNSAALDRIWICLS